jgi:hypothetical protein
VAGMKCPLCGLYSQSPPKDVIAGISSVLNRRLG